MVWNLLCLPVYLVSILGVLPGTDVLRGPFFERLLDLSLPVFLMALTASPSSLPMRRHWSELIAWLYVSIFIAITMVVALGRFGLSYSLVEYRQYLLAAFAIFFLHATRRRFSVSKVVKFGRTYAVMLVLVSLANTLFGIQYRPGVFGESNYDLAALAIIVCGCFRSRQTRNAYALIGAFCAFSLSRTAMLTVLTFAALRLRKLAHIVVLMISATAAIGLLAVRSDQTFSEEGGLTIDRIIMAAAYATEASKAPTFLLAGQPLADARFDIPEMSYYRDAQPVSESLQMNTPSNFHGHLWRGLCLLGAPCYLAFLALVFINIRRSFIGAERILLSVLLLISAISQSIFSHPLVGTMLFAFICTGFNDAAALARPACAWRLSLTTSARGTVTTGA